MRQGRQPPPVALPRPARYARFAMLFDRRPKYAVSPRRLAQIKVCRILLLAAMSFCWLALPPAATAQLAPARGWRIAPEVVAIAAEGDPRRALIDEAIEYWNEVFARIGTPFRLGKAQHVAGAISDSYAAKLSDAVLNRGPQPETPEEVRRWGRRLIIAATGAPIVSFAARLADQRGSLIGLRSLAAAPMGLPNVARNVIAHEIGHALGLGHNNDAAKLMCGRPANCRPDAFQSGERRFFPLTDEEIETLGRIYPKDWKPSD